jgi:hypothetical protein
LAGWATSIARDTKLDRDVAIECFRLFFHPILIALRALSGSADRQFQSSDIAHIHGLSEPAVWPCSSSSRLDGRTAGWCAPVPDARRSRSKSRPEAAHRVRIVHRDLTGQRGHTPMAWSRSRLRLAKVSEAAGQPISRSPTVMIDALATG